MNIEQPLNGMTWRELREFVALGADMDGNEEVDMAFDTDANGEPFALAIYGITLPKAGGKGAAK